MISVRIELAYTPAKDRFVETVAMPCPPQSGNIIKLEDCLYRVLSLEWSVGISGEWCCMALVAKVWAES